jgi:hypothetical protein
VIIYSVKFSQASSRVKMLRFSNVLGTESVPKTLDFNILTWLLAQENFIEFSPHENIKIYIVIICDAQSGVEWYLSFL